MYRERALLYFKRYFLHGIRDGKDADTASSEAMWKARDEILQMIQSDATYPTNVEKETVYADALGELMIFKMLLMDFDKAIEQKKRVAAENTQFENEHTSPPTKIADAVVTGLAEKVQQQDEHLKVNGGTDG